MAAAMLPTGARTVIDSRGQRAIVFPENWSLRYFSQKNPNIALFDLPVDDSPVAA
jgi:hypothetical protein